MGDSIVIIIDQWKWKYNTAFAFPQAPASDDLAKQIIYFIEHNNIHTAVLASFNCSEELYSNTIWYRNRLLVIDPVYSIKNFKMRIDQDYYRFKDHHQSTADILLNYVNPNIFQTAIREQKELEAYLLNYPNIKDIYILGEAWEICVKDRPLGYENVYKKFCLSTDRRVLTHLDCVLTCNGEIPVPDQQWQPVDNLTYQYCPA